MKYVTKEKVRYLKDKITKSDNCISDKSLDPSFLLLEKLNMKRKSGKVKDILKCFGDSDLEPSNSEANMMTSEVKTDLEPSNSEADGMTSEVKKIGKDCYIIMIDASSKI